MLIKSAISSFLFDTCIFDFEHGVFDIDSKEQDERLSYPLETFCTAACDLTLDE
jgi:hypothetical protein